jgi:triacylglycerol lipase
MSSANEATVSRIGTGGRLVGKRIREAVWWAMDYAYAGVWQARGAVSRVRPAHYLTGDLAPVIVIPGIYESWNFMQPVIDAVHSAGHPVHVITALHRNRRPVAFGAAAVVDYIHQQQLSGAIIVSHSKGGLIGKQTMMLLEAEATAPDHDPRARAVASMVAICAPFSGSRYADFMLLPSLRAFRAKNVALMALRANEEVNARIMSVYGRFDPHIPEGSELPGGENVLINTGGHFRILAHPDTIAAVLRGVSDRS